MYFIWYSLYWKVETTYRQPNDHIKSDVISFLILRHKESTVHARKGGNYFRKFCYFQKNSHRKRSIFFAFHWILDIIIHCTLWPQGGNIYEIPIIQCKFLFCFKYSKFVVNFIWNACNKLDNSSGLKRDMVIK